MVSGRVGGWFLGPRVSYLLPPVVLLPFLTDQQDGVVEPLGVQ